MLPQAEELIKLFTERSVTLTTCESPTGGALGAALTDVPGASKVYRGGIVAYDTALKTGLVGVDPELIDADGVVNELTAIQMALGTQARCDSDWAVATTGVAGPTTLDGKDVGTVWFSVVGPKMGMSPRPTYSELQHFEGDRAAVRAAAVEHAISMILRVV